MLIRTLLFCTILPLVGCQCCSHTDRYSNKLDDIADHEPNLDRFYHAEFDLQRIGKADWCRNRLNRTLCRRCR